MGHRVHESDDLHYKEVHCDGYRVIYQTRDEETNEIITIIHSSQQYNPHQKSR